MSDKLCIACRRPVGDRSSYPYPGHAEDCGLAASWKASYERERQLAIALRDSAVHESCRKLGPDDECRWPAFIIGMERCSRARKLIGVPAGMLGKLGDEK